jgi:hypothetical protein
MMKNSALVIAGLIFSVMAIMHALRYVKKWEVIFEHYTIPQLWSVYAAIFTAALAVWMFTAATRR